LTLFGHKGLKRGIRETLALLQRPGGFFGGERGDCDMKRLSKLLPTLARYLLAFAAALYVLSGGAAQAQNIDEGKSAARLFADSCVNCHRSASGLAKGRFRPTLFLFLQDHYTASMGAAWELSAYLASVDTPPKGRSKKTAANSATGANRSPKRPPAPVPSTQPN
jgi:mono/diheme cytochrome c family protein